MNPSDKIRNLLKIAYMQGISDQNYIEPKFDMLIDNLNIEKLDENFERLAIQEFKDEFNQLLILIAVGNGMSILLTLFSAINVIFDIPWVQTTFFYEGLAAVIFCSTLYLVVGFVRDEKAKQNKDQIIENYVKKHGF